MHLLSPAAYAQILQYDRQILIFQLHFQALDDGIDFDAAMLRGRPRRGKRRVIGSIEFEEGR